MGAAPPNEESARVNCSHRCPEGNRQMRRVLNQAANVAVKAKRPIFNVVYLWFAKTGRGPFCAACHVRRLC